MVPYEINFSSQGVMSWSRLGHLVTAWVLTIIVTVPANRLQSCFETLAWLLHLLAEFPFIYSNPIKVTDKPITPYFILWLEHPFWSLGNGLHHEGHGILRQFIDYVGNHSIFSWTSPKKREPKSCRVSITCLYSKLPLASMITRFLSSAGSPEFLKRM